MSTHPTTTAARSSLATSGLVAAGISAVALVVRLIGRVAGYLVGAIVLSLLENAGLFG